MAETRRASHPTLQGEVESSAKVLLAMQTFELT